MTYTVTVHMENGDTRVIKSVPVEDVVNGWRRGLDFVINRGSESFRFEGKYVSCITASPDNLTHKEQEAHP